MPMQGKNITQCACAFLSSTNEIEDMNGLICSLRV